MPATRCLCGRSALRLAACADPALLAAFAAAGRDEEDALDPSAATGISWSALPVADMLKVVQLFGGTAPDIAGVQDKKARLAESITEALLSLGDD